MRAICNLENLAGGTNLPLPLKGASGRRQARISGGLSPEGIGRAGVRPLALEKGREYDARKLEVPQATVGREIGLQATGPTLHPGLGGLRPAVNLRRASPRQCELSGQLELGCGRWQMPEDCKWPMANGQKGLYYRAAPPGRRRGEPQPHWRSAGEATGGAGASRSFVVRFWRMGIGFS